MVDNAWEWWKWEEMLGKLWSNHGKMESTLWDFNSEASELQ